MGKWIVVLMVALCSGCPELAHEVAGTKDMPAQTGGEEGDDVARDQAEGASEGGGGVLDAGASDEPAEDGEPSGGGGDPDGGMAEPAPLPTPWWDGVWQVSAYGDGISSGVGACTGASRFPGQQAWRVHADGFSALQVEREIDGVPIERLFGSEWPIGSGRFKLVTETGDVHDSWDVVFDESRRALEGSMHVFVAQKQCYALRTVAGSRVGDHVQ